jgi:hypothetical protein
VLAAGVAYHAGTGSWGPIGYGGNSVVWGTEAQNDGTGQPWPAPQVAAYVTLSAALAVYFGFGAAAVHRHAEWALPAGRKFDAWGPWEGTPHRWELHAGVFRDLVAQRIAAGPGGGDPVDYEAVAAYLATLDKEHSMFIIKVKGAPGPATLLDVEGNALPLTSAEAIKALAERYPLVELSRAGYDKQLAKAVPWWRRVLRVRLAQTTPTP